MSEPYDSSHFDPTAGDGPQPDPETAAAQESAADAETAAAQTPDAGTASFAEDGTYRIVRPDEQREPEGEKSYQDSYYTPAHESIPTGGYYVPDEPPKKAPRAKKPHSGRGPGWKVACLCLACALLGGLGGGAIGAAVVNKAPAETTDNTQNTPGSGVLTTQPVSSGTMSSGEIYAEACKQVVGVTTEVTYSNMFGQTSSSAVAGTGFVITSDGYILTNYHVISYADQYGYDVSVMTYDGTSYAAKIIGTEPDNDVAVLKIDAAGLTPVTFGDSDSMAVGDTVYAVGNPLGELQFSMSNGMVSALDRTITTEEGSTPINMFQITAAVNEGNSGGPVYNTSGQVIGIVTAKYSSSGVEGLGFAIPINDAVNIANELMENGYVTGKAALGVMTTTIPASVAQYYNMVEGALISSVNAGSAAEKAGLKAGDIITALGDTAVSSSDALSSAMRSYAAGDTATLTIYRDGKSLQVSVTFDEKTSSNSAQSAAPQRQPQSGLPFQIG